MTSDSDIAKMFDWIESNADLGKVDVCVPNAGFAAASSLLDGETTSIICNNATAIYRKSNEKVSENCFI